MSRKEDIDILRKKIEEIEKEVYMLSDEELSQVVGCISNVSISQSISGLLNNLQSK